MRLLCPFGDFKELVFMEPVVTDKTNHCQHYLNIHECGLYTVK